jgi:hypothetical protein
MKWSWFLAALPWAQLITFAGAIAVAVTAWRIWR